MEPPLDPPGEKEADVVFVASRGRCVREFLLQPVEYVPVRVSKGVEEGPREIAGGRFHEIRPDRRIGIFRVHLLRRRQTVVVSLVHVNRMAHAVVELRRRVQLRLVAGKRTFLPKTREQPLLQGGTDHDDRRPSVRRQGRSVLYVADRTDGHGPPRPLRLPRGRRGGSAEGPHRCVRRGDEEEIGECRGRRGDGGEAQDQERAQPSRTAAPDGSLPNIWRRRRDRGGYRRRQFHF
mmetsp:Transcript_30255/g.69346  ORF Transcript_30255/g.69346 Transcript_30255/m.69346 type:complete len:235 (+) Transcript_30255:157-861(+)